MSPGPAPSAIELRPDRLVLRWPGEKRVLAASQLRAACRCAGCRAAASKGEPRVAASSVRLLDVRPVGHYAVQLVFDDGHERGIYPWSMLHGLRNESPLLQGAAP